MHRFTGHLTHVYGKLQKNVIFVLFILFFFGGFITSEYLAKNDLAKITLDKNQCLSQLEKPKRNNVQFTKEDINLAVEKEKTLEKVIASLVSFSQTVTRTTPSKSTVTIRLQGVDSMKIDAADLVLHYSSNLKILDIIPGQTFSLYPKQLISEDSISVSGVASVTDNSINFGQLNKSFVTFVVEKIGDQKQEGILTIDTINTKVYFQGTSVLDQDNQISQIVF